MCRVIQSLFHNNGQATATRDTYRSVLTQLTFFSLSHSHLLNREIVNKIISHSRTATENINRTSSLKSIDEYLLMNTIHCQCQSIDRIDIMYERSLVIHQF
jgi:hypothetical protein